jgi:hypothetical protein
MSFVECSLTEWRWSPLCNPECDAENGALIENSNNCQIKVYLQEICARLKWNEEEQQWTKPDLRPTQQFT